MSLASSLLLSFAPQETICNLNEGCSVVQNSSYSYTFGIKNSHYGILIFTILSIITFSQIKKNNKLKEQIIHASILIGALIAMYFIYIQAFVLNAWCKYCMVVDISLIFALIILGFTYKKK